MKWTKVSWVLQICAVYSHLIPKLLLSSFHVDYLDHIYVSFTHTH